MTKVTYTYNCFSGVNFETIDCPGLDIQALSFSCDEIMTSNHNMDHILPVKTVTPIEGTLLLHKPYPDIIDTFTIKLVSCNDNGRILILLINEVKVVHAIGDCLTFEAKQIVPWHDLSKPKNGNDIRSEEDSLDWFRKMMS